MTITDPAALVALDDKRLALSQQLLSRREQLRALLTPSR